MAAGGRIVAAMMHTGTLFDPDPDAFFAEVAVPVPAGGPFTYRVPEHASSQVMPGSRVVVPFSGRRLTGVVVATRAAPPIGLEASKIRSLHDCLDPLPLLSPVLLALTNWVAAETMSAWGEAIRTALPSGVNRISRRRIALTDEGAATVIAANEATGEGSAAASLALMAILAEAKGATMTLGALSRRFEGSATCARLYDLVGRGLVTVEDEWSSGVGGRWKDVVVGCRHITLETARQRTSRAPLQRRAVERLWDGDRRSLTVEGLCRAADCSPATVKALVTKGVAEVRREAIADETVKAWAGDDDGAGTFDLTAAQAEALGTIRAREAGFRSLLLHGVTGSGKTEVYLRAAQEAMAGGRTAILLVPEIGLTPLLAHRATAVFGDAVGVMHSGMSEGERLATWWRARGGAIRAVIGPRSAIFAPLENVGLIVVDEEQDGAYKQDETPRYHGRDVALRRAELEDATLVLGSATPAVETCYLASRGRHQRASMPDRVAQRPLPRVEIVDMRDEWTRAGRSLLSEPLEQAIGDCLGRGEQALLLLNRRGFAASLLCRACGERIPCPHCSVSLTYHKPERCLRCHYCDHRQPVPEKCPTCEARQIHEVGHGTQRLHQQLAKLFPEARLRRFDADETRRKGAHAEILSAFGRGELDLLVGTQMLAKGHDFPGVTLVGAVGADDALTLPDFRAAERTFQLLTQMAGRAGRGELPGSVVLQAFQPDHYALRAAVSHDYAAFYEQEIEYRRRLRYPPFASLISCLCRGGELVVVKEEADHLATALREVAGDHVDVLGPASPPLGKLRGRHRIQVLLRGPDSETLRQTLAEAIDQCRQRRRLPRDLRIDVGPLNLM